MQTLYEIKNIVCKQILLAVFNMLLQKFYLQIPIFELLVFVKRAKLITQKNLRQQCQDQLYPKNNCNNKVTNKKNNHKTLTSHGTIIQICQ